MNARTYRLQESVSQRLEQVAATSSISSEEHLNAAVERYLELYEWQVEGIKAAQRELDAGGGVPHAEVMAEIQRMIDRATS
ncbi:MAG: hypothetical protein SFV21_00955 [Rhodospirillaceae bacterium]|nr:hypothetical protein [Rhodospirillaceae bacterium]